MRRPKGEQVRIETTEDILAGMAHVSRELERCEQANDYIQARIVACRKHISELQQQVIEATGYEYGREGVVT